MKIQNGRLVIRDFTISDVESFSVLAADPEVTRYLYWGPLDQSQAKKFIQRAVDLAVVKTRRKFILAIENDRAEMLGYIFLNVKSFINAEAEITYCLKKKYWGVGYGTEAIRLVLDFAFKKLKLHRVFARIDQENSRSEKLLKKNGFVYEGRLRQDAYMKGEWRDSEIYSILAHEFISDTARPV
jgi:RimJ/RimL family protein N-acetyltransferase